MSRENFSTKTLLGLDESYSFVNNIASSDSILIGFVIKQLISSSSNFSSKFKGQLIESTYLSVLLYKILIFCLSSDCEYTGAITNGLKVMLFVLPTPDVIDKSVKGVHKNAILENEIHTVTAIITGPNSRDISSLTLSFPFTLGFGSTGKTSQYLTAFSMLYIKL